MYASTIDSIIDKDKSLRKIFIGTLARDELPKSMQYPCCFILNTQPRNKEGEHWLALFYDSNRNCDFFDSYGLGPHYHGLEAFILRTSVHCRYNKRQIQGTSNYCGVYAILFLKYRIRNNYDNKFFRDFVKQYTLNDLKIKKSLQQ
jgi:hypothetical protein